MIFQYTRTLSELDSKRHYEWKCVSDQHDHVFMFLSPNGNRSERIICNTMGYPSGSFKTIASFVKAGHLNPDELEWYNKLIVDYPMFAHIIVNGQDLPNEAFTVWFRGKDDDSDTYQHLISVIEVCHFHMIKIEYELLELDEERKSKQQLFSLYNELTNVLSKVDILNCLQQLTMKDTSKDEKHPVTPSPSPPLTLREDLSRVNIAKRRGVFHQNEGNGKRLKFESNSK